MTDPDHKYDESTTSLDECPPPYREEIHMSAERRKAEITASASTSASASADTPATEQPPSPTMPQTPSPSSNTEQGEYTTATSPAAGPPGYFVDGYPEELHPDGLSTSTLRAREAARQGSAVTPEAEECYRKLDRVLGPTRSQNDDLHDLDDKLQHTSLHDTTSEIQPGASGAAAPRAVTEPVDMGHLARPGVSRHDTDSYEDYPSTSPRVSPTDPDASLPPTLGSPFSPTRMSPSAELHVSPYASEHDVPTTPSPLPRKTPSPELGQPGSRNEDHYTGKNPEEHMDYGDNPSPPASPAPAHQGSASSDNHGEKKVGIVEKVAQMLGKSDIKDSEESQEQGMNGSGS